ncbi:MAG: UTP--glucose-1-phosphate uridylyltransferase [Chloroflexi bacterium ADurb.Bin325]|nr:MAG: UTP--glucose-1-phosphate uridylyltransferase [Chloroflexi bacterium ADurb.Bin325]
MKISKAVITAASPRQRALPLQTLVDRDGVQKSVLRIIVEEALRAGVEEIAIVVCPDDEAAYAGAAGDLAARLTFVPQPAPRGYGHAVYCARDFTGQEPFLHLVGDHLWVSRNGQGCAEQLVEAAEREACAISAVQASRETLLPYFGAVGGRRVPGRQDLYVIENVLEKPTPTEAEQHLLVPGLRAGHYLCFFGLHVLTASVMELLGRAIRAGQEHVTLSQALAELAAQERHLALERPWNRYDVGVQYGLLTAQLALALAGRDRERVLALLLELLAQREAAA